MTRPIGFLKVTVYPLRHMQSTIIWFVHYHCVVPNYLGIARKTDQNLLPFPI